MFAAFKRWKREQKRQRQLLKLRQPESYPPDMSPETVDTIIRVKDFTMTSPERIHGLCDAVRYITTAGIQGDIVECGVWRGGSMMAVADTLQKLDVADRNLHLFDTFCGMSAPTEKDVAVTGKTADSLLECESKEEATSVWCVSPLDEVRSNMASTGYPKNQIFYHEGKVEDTIPAAAPQRIALLRLDTDWYESTRHELVHLFPRLANGGVIIIDDYGHWKGSRRAVDEYFAQHGIAMILHRLDYTGRMGVYNSSVRQAKRLNQTSIPARMAA